MAHHAPSQLLISGAGDSRFADRLYVSPAGRSPSIIVLDGPPFQVGLASRRPRNPFPLSLSEIKIDTTVDAMAIFLHIAFQVRIFPKMEA